MKTITIFLLAAVLVLGACSNTRTVTRTSVDNVQDISGKWNSNDIQMVARQLITDVLSRPWLVEYVEENGAKPVVTVGTVRNKSSEHLETRPLVVNFQTELINSGKVKFVADIGKRSETRNERLEQQTHASEETASRIANETASDFVLQGEVTTIIDAMGGKQVKYYNVSMRLVNTETNEIVWQGKKEIVKNIAQRGAKW